MHQDNIDTLCAESIRILEVEINFFNNMLNQEGVVVNSKDNQEQTFDRDSIPKYIEVLEGEKTKLQNLDMVLAVVGTMKAGKSSTINAIVGTEVLPNRNRPMTALPTLIRHTPGKTTPVLKFDNVEPVNRLVQNLYEAIKNIDREKSQEMSDNQDMKELLHFIKNQEKFGVEYIGSEEIYWFLKSLNDLVRISSALNVDFPFQDYDEIHEMPVIQVEFAHLRNMKETQGCLTLLDTPGPNEAGQGHLRKMLKDQLKKASAILAVMDYTQLKSDADAEVRKELIEIAEISQGRLYALVNKFDQKDKNGDKEDAVKEIVAKQLMGGTISEKHVFPVSSKQAYLANRVLNELHIHGKLPNLEGNEWIEDFCELALGTGWSEEDIDDLSTVKERAKRLWTKSKFDEPMRDVIQTAHSRAAAFAIDSAATKLTNTATELNNFLGIRENALTKSAEELKDQIQSLLQDAESIEKAEKNTQNQIKKILSAIKSASTNSFRTTKAELKDSLENYFKEGKRIAASQAIEYQNERRKSESRSHSGFWGSIVFGKFDSASNSEQETSRDFDPKNPIVKFNDGKAPKELIQRIQKTVNSVIASSEGKLIQSIQTIQDDLRVNFSTEMRSAVDTIIKTMKGRMATDGFSVELPIHSPRLPSLEISSTDLFDNVLEEKSKDVTRQRRQSGVWGSVCSLFGTDDWGWESYTVQETYFEINIKSIESSILGEVDRSFDKFQKLILEVIQKPLEKDVENYFNSFKAQIEHMRADLQQGIRDQESSKAEQEALAIRIRHLRRNVPELLEDSQGLVEDIKPLLKSDDEVTA